MEEEEIIQREKSFYIQAHKVSEIEDVVAMKWKV
jgi:SepF-like predicted cell division protein (DUF552 family)